MTQFIPKLFKAHRAELRSPLPHESYHFTEGTDLTPALGRPAENLRYHLFETLFIGPSVHDELAEQLTRVEGHVLILRDREIEVYTKTVEPLLEGVQMPRCRNYDRRFARSQAGGNEIHQCTEKGVVIFIDLHKMLGRREFIPENFRVRVVFGDHAWAILFLTHHESQERHGRTQNDAGVGHFGGMTLFRKSP